MSHTIYLHPISVHTQMDSDIVVGAVDNGGFFVTDRYANHPSLIARFYDAVRLSNKVYLPSVKLTDTSCCV